MNKMTISIYLLMILNVIRLNALITKAGWMNGLKNMTNLYAAYKTLQIKRHIRTERYYMQMEIKKSTSGNTYIRKKWMFKQKPYKETKNVTLSYRNHSQKTI